MTRREVERQLFQANTLIALGFTAAEAEQLRRISMTLHSWSEAECNGDIERDGDDGDGKPYRSFAANGGKHHAYRIADRERGALKRLQAIVDARNKRVRASLPVITDEDAANARPGADTTDLQYYVQGDPRGCSLYILRPGDVPAGKQPDGYYSRGIAVY
jgi:hypothetical protein